MPTPKKAAISKTELPPGNDLPIELMQSMDVINDRLTDGDPSWFKPVPTGFPELDRVLQGGAHIDDLILIGGPQNVGKTAKALQMARNMARYGKTVLFLCYEHGPDVLTERVLCQESDEAGAGISIGSLYDAYLEALTQKKEFVEKNPSAPIPGMLDLVGKIIGPSYYQAVSRMDTYWHNLLLVRGDGLSTHIEAIENYINLVRKHYAESFVLFVDYAQRVPVMPRSGAHLDYLQRIDIVLRGLKSYAIKYHIPVVAVAAADMEGLRKGHIHVENLWGPVTVQYEPDVCLILNPIREGLVRVAIEKNRHGPTDKEWDVEFRGQFTRFDLKWRPVPPEESWQSERGRLLDKAVTAKDTPEK